MRNAVYVEADPALKNRIMLASYFVACMIEAFKYRGRKLANICTRGIWKASQCFLMADRS